MLLSNVNVCLFVSSCCTTVGRLVDVVKAYVW
jgi:hypothetical protein